VNNDDERDFDEEAANRELLDSSDGEADYEITPADTELLAARHAAERGALTARHSAEREAEGFGQDDPDLVADAMTALEKRILAAVPAGQRSAVAEQISDLLAMHPGDEMTPKAAREIARKVLAGADDEINARAKFYPLHKATDDEEWTGHPCIGLGGNEAGDGEVQVYVYYEAGGLVISQHFDTAEGGPWAAYGDGAIPVTVIGGDGLPVYVANEQTPDIGEWAARGWLALSELQDAGIEDDATQDVADALTALLAAAGRPWQPDVQGGKPE
jgi:hypothetical protein